MIVQYLVVACCGILPWGVSYKSCKHRFTILVLSKFFIQLCNVHMDIYQIQFTAEYLFIGRNMSMLINVCIHLYFFTYYVRFIMISFQFRIRMIVYILRISLLDAFLESCSPCGIYLQRCVSALLCTNEAVVYLFCCISKLKRVCINFGLQAWILPFFMSFATLQQSAVFDLFASCSFVALFSLNSSLRRCI